MFPRSFVFFSQPGATTHDVRPPSTSYSPSLCPGALSSVLCAVCAVPSIHSLADSLLHSSDRSSSPHSLAVAVS